MRALLRTFFVALGIIGKCSRRSRIVKENAISDAANWIVVHGARTHNLRVDQARLPIGRIVAISGVSGSGKSSLAFDTIYVEGLRRFLETLSPGARRRIEQWPRPNVESIDNLPPTLSVEQTAPRANPRATVATVAELQELLGALFAHFGKLHCTQCQAVVGMQTFEELVDRTAALPTGTRVLILAPLARHVVGDLREHFLRIRRDGFLRARLDGVQVMAEQPPSIDPGVSHDLDLVIDRQVIATGIRDRLAESLATALRHGQGAAAVAREVEGKWIDEPFAARGVCTVCGHRAPEVESSWFNFNSPVGACADCRGFGVKDGDRCSSCMGSRLGPLAKCVLLDGAAIDAWCHDPIDLVAQRLGRVMPSPMEGKWRLAKPMVDELRRRLDFLERVGLGHLELDRSIDTLSGGEAHRARLAGCVAAGCTGVVYVLDEPTAGLHARDVERLWQLIIELRDRGNTVIVVEHDRLFLERADWLIDIGPGAGSEGGRVVFQGFPVDLPNSVGVTADYVAGRKRVVESIPTIVPSQNGLTLTSVRVRNLNIDELRIPLGRMACFAGVSGSGKSTLMHEALLPALRRAMLLTDRPVTGVGSIKGFESISRIVEVDQQAIADAIRSTPATASGAMEHLRKLFAKTRTAKLRGFTAIRFSYNDKAGQCAACKGLGVVVINDMFGAGSQIACDECDGARYNAATLAATYRDRNIAQVLEMSIAEAAVFLANVPKLSTILATLVEVGLGYLRLGQTANSLSGGEAQRLKLAAELAKADQLVASTLYVLDEPTTGLHFDDVRRLLELLRRLQSAGNSILVVEHHLDVLAASDWIIELGPDSGAAGGRIIAEGTPCRIASMSTATGNALATKLSRSP